MQYHCAGRLAEAEEICRQILAHIPEEPEALHLLGMIAMQVAQPEAASDFFRRAIAGNPAAPAYHSNLAVALMALGRLPDAISAVKDALRLQPDFADAHYNLGKALNEQGRFDDALAAYRAAIQFRPDLALAYNNIGVILHDRGQPHEAAAAYRRAVELSPGIAESHGNLGNALKDLGRSDEAIASIRRAIELQPHNSVFGSNLIMARQYSSSTSAAELAAEQRRWNDRHATPLRALWQPHENVADPERPLRIGYVSADFRQHVVGRTLLPCYEAHDRSQFEVVCYAGCDASDAVAMRFRRGAALWREAYQLSDEKFAATIREDRIDILVDLSLHTARNRLSVFARKPAPVQVSWLGYPGTTGVEAIDFHITDSFLEAPGSEPPAGREEPLRMPEAWCCYAPPTDGPEPEPPPVAHRGFVTFGSFNNAAKINERVLACWAEMLRRVDGARLALLSKTGRREDIERFFQQRGIAPDRVEFIAYYPPPESHRGESSDEFLRRYARIDIALDPFPYNGMTTTCDALWMGVPVVALIGATPISRASFSLLSNVGLPELAARSEEEYVALAASLAGDLPRLAGLRATLRARLKASPLLDPARFTRHLEAAYRSVWRRWCKTKLAR